MILGELIHVQYMYSPHISFYKLTMSLKPYLSSRFVLLKSGVFGSDRSFPKRTSSTLLSAPSLSDKCSVKTKSNSSSQAFNGLQEGERCFSKSSLGVTLDNDSFCFSVAGDFSITGSGDFSIAGDSSTTGIFSFTGDVCTATLSSNESSSGFFVLDKGMFVKCPESKLSEANEVR